MSNEAPFKEDDPAKAGGEVWLVNETATESGAVQTR